MGVQLAEISGEASPSPGTIFEERDGDRRLLYAATDGLREIEEGRTEEEMKRTREMSEELLRRITDEGMKSYFENASADTKIDLAPLMEAMDDVMKGMRGREFGPPQ